MVVLAAVAGVLCTLSAVGLGAATYWAVRLRPQQATAIAAPPPPASDMFPPPPSPYRTPAPPAKSQPIDIYQTVMDDEIPTSFAWLEGIGGVISGQRIEVYREETVLGRSRVCDVQIHDPKVSRQHALLRLYNGRYFIQDMQSSRGTLVNSRSIETHPLAEGDEIRLGDTTMVFHLPTKA